VGKCGLDSSWLRIGTSECGNDPSDYMEGRWKIS
jgi:hypothetical protein